MGDHDLGDVKLIKELSHDEDVNEYPSGRVRSTLQTILRSGCGVSPLS
jgi:hypothetical protein